MYPKVKGEDGKDGLGTRQRRPGKDLETGRPACNSILLTTISGVLYPDPAGSSYLTGLGTSRKKGVGPRKGEGNSA